MNEKAITAEIDKLNESGLKFLAACEDEILEFLRAEETTAEEGLQKDIFLELMEHIYGIRHIAEYMKKDVAMEGVLSRNEKGDILFDGEILPLMKEIEVLVYEEEAEHEVWTRTFVGGADRKYLVGLNRNCEISGMHARIRE